MTICYECNNFKSLGGHNAHIWYSHLCKAKEVQLEEVTNPTTGKTGYGTVNSLGMDCVTDRAEPYCRDVNDGNCKHFVPKVSWLSLLGISKAKENP